ncbi:hypothetical protein CC2G_015006 [Coprinopsis cinerea AmutBmut pab1-1]|nr:hypothetical protein CC2G_015006 [Coprinopsis cinerea AmutBmut pab1-1]
MHRLHLHSVRAARDTALRNLRQAKRQDNRRKKDKVPTPSADLCPPSSEHPDGPNLLDGSQSIRAACGHCDPPERLCTIGGPMSSTTSHGANNRRLLACQVVRLDDVVSPTARLRG